MTEQASQVNISKLAVGLVGNVTRVALTVVSVPLVVLPQESRQRVRKAVADASLAIVALPRELSDMGEKLVEQAYEGKIEAPQLPRVEEVTDRVRNFTERMGRAAQEFTSSVANATSRAGDAVEQTAARVDEWVEKP